MKSPMAAGAASLGVDPLLYSTLQAGMAGATIQVKDTASSRDKLICMDIDTAPRQAGEDTCSL